MPRPKKVKKKESNLESTLVLLRGPGADQPFDTVWRVLQGSQG
jgi:hypothetical protein